MLVSNDYLKTQSTIANFGNNHSLSIGVTRQKRGSLYFITLTCRTTDAIFDELLASLDTEQVRQYERKLYTVNNKLQPKDLI